MSSPGINLDADLEFDLFAADDESFALFVDTYAQPPIQSVNTSFSEPMVAPPHPPPPPLHQLPLASAQQPLVTPRRPLRKLVLNMTTTPTAMRMSPINLAQTGPSKVQKTHHRNHLRLLLRILMDFNQQILTPQVPQVPFSPGLGPGAAVMGALVAFCDEVTPLPTPTSNLAAAPPLGPAFGPPLNNVAGRMYLPAVPPFPLQRADTLELIKIEDQDDDAFKQLKKAKLYLLIPKARQPPISLYNPPSSATAAPIPAGIDDFSQLLTPSMFYDNSPIHFDPHGMPQGPIPSQQSRQQQPPPHHHQQQQRKPGFDLLSQFDFDGIRPYESTDELTGLLPPMATFSTANLLLTLMNSSFSSLHQLALAPVPAPPPPPHTQESYVFPPIQEHLEDGGIIPLPQIVPVLAPSPAYGFPQVPPPGFRKGVGSQVLLQTLIGSQVSGDLYLDSYSEYAPSMDVSYHHQPPPPIPPQHQLHLEPTLRTIAAQDLPPLVALTLMAPDFNVDIPVVKLNRDKLDKNDPKKKHKCPICDLRFQRPEHVKRHLKSHSLEKPFVCDEPLCNKRFNRKDNLKAHLKKIHQRKNL